MFTYQAVSEKYCIIYRRDLQNLQANRKKLKKYLTVETEISTNVNIKSVFKYDYS